MKLVVNKFKVSVCVVTYNQEHYIRECLQSIVDQETDFRFEMIVSDDCSTDGTRAIIQEFAEKYPEIIKPVYHGKNIGAIKNFVSAHNMASADLVSHCDGDDLFLPKKLQRQFDYFSANPGCAVVWHRVNLFDDMGNFFSGEKADYSMFKDGIVTLEKALSFGSVAVHSSIMYRRTARKTVNPAFDVLDLFYSWEYLSSGWGVILDEVLGEYRVNSSGAISRSPNFKIRALNAHHSGFYFAKFPEKRLEIFLFSLTNFLVDLKNRRKTAFVFFVLALRSFSLVSPLKFISHLRQVRKFRVPLLSEKRK